MENQFKAFLKAEGYAEYTPSGNKSTVYDYIGRVKRIIEWENITWELLKNNINNIVCVYDIGGEKEDIGKKSHNSYINALKAFQRFADKF